MKKTIALVFATLSVATFGCKKNTDTANPEETKTEAPADANAGTPPAEGEGEKPAEGAPAEGGDAAATPTP
jgi:hypothetical protein